MLFSTSRPYIFQLEPEQEQAYACLTSLHIMIHTNQRFMFYLLGYFFCLLVLFCLALCLFFFLASFQPSMEEELFKLQKNLCDGSSIRNTMFLATN